MAENYFGLTDTGKVRDNNEDTFIAQPIAEDRYILACVIDGVGGYHGGEVAAAIAREEIIKNLENTKGEIIPEMIRAFKRASDKIYLKKQEDKNHDQMACVATLVVADVDNNLFYYAHVGDTRLYLLRDGSLVKISKDHSFVGFLEDSGRLTETAAMKHPKRNEINKALGFNEQIDTDDSYIETGQSPFLPGDMLLLCSDGLTDMVDKNDITEMITQSTTLQQRAAALIEAANANGGRDNITVVLVQNDKTPNRQNATMPPASPEKKKLTEKGVIPSRENSKTVVAAPAKKNNTLAAILLIFCLALLGLSVWLFMQWQKTKPAVVQTANAIPAKRNDQEVLLQDAFDNAAGDTLILSDTIFKSPVIINDTLSIKSDTLYIKAKGNIVLQRDTAYHGPAIVISPGSRVIVLDSLQFNDFDTVISMNNTLLYLKNARFINCSVPVNNTYRFGSKEKVTAKIPVVIMAVDSAKNRVHDNGTR